MKLRWAVPKGETIHGYVARAEEALAEAPKLEGAVVLDLGAHVGTVSVLAASRGAARVIALEPNPDNFLALVQNVRVNDQWGRVVPLPLAVAATTGTARLTSAGGSGQRSLLYKNVGQESFAVQTVAFEDLLANVIRTFGRIDLLKMDLEGGEWPIFAHARKGGNVAALLERVRYFDLELHDVSDEDYFEPGQSADVDGLKRWLAELGFEGAPEPFRLWFKRTNKRFGSLLDFDWKQHAGV